MDNQIQIEIIDRDLSLEDAFAWINTSGCGGNAYFIGTTRQNNKGKEVMYLEFESYVSMAKKELQKIALKAIEIYALEQVYIAHRLGRVHVKEKAVVIACSSPHRKASINGCSFIIDRLKETVPIWKKEFTTDGSQWVSPTP